MAVNLVKTDWLSILGNGLPAKVAGSINPTNPSSLFHAEFNPDLDPAPVIMVPDSKSSYATERSAIQAWLNADLDTGADLQAFLVLRARGYSPNPAATLYALVALVGYVEASSMLYAMLLTLTPGFVGTPLGAPYSTALSGVPRGFRFYADDHTVDANRLHLVLDTNVNGVGWTNVFNDGFMLPAFYGQVGMWGIGAGVGGGHTPGSSNRVKFDDVLMSNADSALAEPPPVVTPPGPTNWNVTFESGDGW